MGNGAAGKKDWLGGWIGQGENGNENKSNAPLFTGKFQIKDRDCIVSARLYISGLGIYQASLNGNRISDTLFDPGESDAAKTVYYRTYDVLEGLGEGENVLGVILGNGQMARRYFKTGMVGRITMPQRKFRTGICRGQTEPDGLRHRRWKHRKES